MDKRHDVPALESKKKLHVFLELYQGILLLLHPHLPRSVLLAQVTDLPKAGAVWKANADLPYQIVSDDILFHLKSMGTCRCVS